jgi:hypothetical protein
MVPLALKVAYFFFEVRHAQGNENCGRGRGSEELKGDSADDMHYSSKQDFTSRVSALN